MMKLQRYKYLLVVIGSATAVLALAAAGIFWFTRSPISNSILKQISFTVFTPKTSNHLQLKADTIKYDAKLKQLSYIVQFQNQAVTVAQQSTPDQFSDIPDYYPKLIEKMNAYASFENSLGKVNLTRPTEIKNQVAVMNTKGTLLFAQSSSDLTPDQWRRLFNTLTIDQSK